MALLVSFAISGAFGLEYSTTISHFQLSLGEFILIAEVIGWEACEEPLGAGSLRYVGVLAAWTSACCPCRNGAEVFGGRFTIVST